MNRLVPNGMLGGVRGGRDFPLLDLNRREMQYRVEKAREQGVYITNYGVLIAYVMGILPRAIKPFPAASMALDELDLNY